MDEATQIEVIDPVADYAEVMRSLFDFALMRGMFAKGFRMRFDAMSAVCGPYAKAILEGELENMQVPTLLQSINMSKMTPPVSATAASEAVAKVAILAILLIICFLPAVLDKSLAPLQPLVFN